uniref:Uncharacterized protein n=1 Tax=Solanum lycopersicum TaxID=4081 RepID=A0A3Q7FZ66_SOLLC
LSSIWDMRQTNSQLILALVELVFDWDFDVRRFPQCDPEMSRETNPFLSPNASSPQHHPSPNNSSPDPSSPQHHPSPNNISTIPFNKLRFRLFSICIELNFHKDTLNLTWKTV